MYLRPKFSFCKTFIEAFLIYVPFRKQQTHVFEFYVKTDHGGHSELNIQYLHVWGEWHDVVKLVLLTHWGWVMHICVSKLTNTGSENGLSPVRRHNIIWTNAGILLIGTLETNFSEILIEI